MPVSGVRPVYDRYEAKEWYSRQGTGIGKRTREATTLAFVGFVLPLGA